MRGTSQGISELENEDIISITIRGNVLKYDCLWCLNSCGLVECAAQPTQRTKNQSGIETEPDGGGGVLE